jgi:hypothetical protein
MRRAPRLSLHSLALAPVLALALASCSGTSGRTGSVTTSRQAAPTGGVERALIYGHIKAPKPLQAVQLSRMLSPRHPSATVLPNGDFYVDVAPGDWALMRFKAGNQWYTLMTGDRENNRRFMVTATAGGMHYAGSWRVTGEKHNRITPSEFGMERTAQPNEKTLLNRLRPALAGTRWERKGGTEAARAAKPHAPANAGSAPRAKKGKGNGA